MPTSVFISYSHDSQAHRDFVRSIADKLRDDGVNCQIDQYINGFPPQGWQRWMETQVEAADFVLLVCTETYLQRYRGLATDGGRGVNFEGVVISQTLYDHYYRNTKFIPVIPNGGDLEHVPLPLKGFSTYTLQRDYTQLYRVLTDQPVTPAPDLGEPVKLNPKKQSAAVSLRHDELAESQSNSQQPERASTITKEGKLPMSTTMKAAYIGVGATLLAAIIAGLFSLLAAPGNTVTGKCGNVITGSGGGNVSINCPEGEK